MTIGRAIKSLVKFQRCEIMHGLVKLGDIEDMAEPRLHGSMATPPATQRVQDKEDMPVDSEDHRGNPSGGYLRLKDSPLGIHPSTTI